MRQPTEMESPKDSPDLFASRIVRPAELAQTLGVSKVTLWRWERAGRLPKKYRLGPNVVGWLASDIEDWFAANSPAAAEGPQENGR